MSIWHFISSLCNHGHALQQFVACHANASEQSIGAPFGTILNNLSLGTLINMLLL
jgi:hypothetical protein